MRIDFARIDLIGVDFVRVDLVALNPFRKPLFRVFTNSVHKPFTAELMDVSGLWDSNEK